MPHLFSTIPRSTRPFACVPRVIFRAGAISSGCGEVVQSKPIAFIFPHSFPRRCVHKSWCLVATKTPDSAPQLQKSSKQSWISQLWAPRQSGVAVQGSVTRRHDLPAHKARDRSVILRFASAGFGPFIQQAGELPRSGPQSPSAHA